MQHQLGFHGRGTSPALLQRPGTAARRPATAPNVTAISAPPRPSTSGREEVCPLDTAAPMAP